MNADPTIRIIPVELAGQRLDRALAKLFPEFSRSRLKAWLLDGAIRVDGDSPRPRDPVQGGETVALSAEPEAGTTAEENNTVLMEGPDPSIVSTELGSAGTGPMSNVTGSGTETLSSTVTVEPGDSIWLWAILQSLAANGAEVSATLDTKLVSTKVD